MDQKSNSDVLFLSWISCLQFSAHTEVQNPHFVAPVNPTTFQNRKFRQTDWHPERIKRTVNVEKHDNLMIILSFKTLPMLLLLQQR